jgi:transcription elongation factor Elf1
MGSFNTILITCPTCNYRNSVQTKSGSCMMNTYDVRDAPLPDLTEVVEEAEEERLLCEQCEKKLQIRVQKITTVEVL